MKGDVVMNNIAEIMLRRKNMIELGGFPDATIDLMKEQDRHGVLEFMPESMKRVIFAATVAKNMESFGFTPSKDLMNEMLADEGFTAKIHQYIMPELVKLKGGDLVYEPMYKNFPREVMNMSEAELYVNAIIHYATTGQWMPNSVAEKREELNERVKFTTLDVSTEQARKDLFTNLLNSSVPFSQQDLDDITELSKHYNIMMCAPDRIVNKENLANVIKLSADMVDDNKDKGEIIKSFSKHINSVNDVLRIMNVVHGDGDATLTDRITVAKVPRSMRRVYLSLIDKCKNAPEDMKINQKMWIRVGEILHPGEYAQYYKNAASAFEKMRDVKQLSGVHTYNAVAEKVIRSDDKEKLSEFAKQKPGVIARNLDRLLRQSNDKDAVLDIWKEASLSVAPNLLWQVHSHFSRKLNEYDEKGLRIFVTKGPKSTTKVVEDNTEKIGKLYLSAVIDATERALREQYKNKPAMGNVYIDKEVARCKVPNGTRDAQQGSVPMAKGSRIPLNENANVLRGFIWWTNTDKKDYYGSGRVDIDLSAAMLDKDLKLVNRCAYYDLKGQCYTHSGDITDGGTPNGKGVAEFIDIDIEKAKEQGIRYFCFTVDNYTGHRYQDMEHVRFGFMEREKELEGEIFEPSTVKQTIKLNAPSTSATMCMFDLEKREMIWMDEVGQDIFRRSEINNLDTNWQGTAMVCYKALHLEKPNIEDVIRVNVEARGGRIVDNKEKADLVFALNEGIKPTDLDYFAGNLLPKDVVEVKRADVEKIAEEKQEDVALKEERTDEEEVL